MTEGKEGRLYRIYIYLYIAQYKCIASCILCINTITNNTNLPLCIRVFYVDRWQKKDKSILIPLCNNNKMWIKSRGVNSFWWHCMLLTFEFKSSAYFSKQPGGQWRTQTFAEPRVIYIADFFRDIVGRYSVSSRSLPGLQSQPWDALGVVKFLHTTFWTCNESSEIVPFATVRDTGLV